MKRLIKTMITTLVFSAVMIQTAAVGYSATRYIGDVDLDGEVTITDATVIQRVLAEMIEDTDGHILRYGDINGGGLSIMDVTLIQRYLAQFTDGYPIGSLVDDELLPTEKPTEQETAPVVVNGKVTVDGVTFDVSAYRIRL